MKPSVESASSENIYYGSIVPDPVTILTLTFNSDRLHVCGTFRKSIRCHNPDFWPKLKEIITSLRPVVVTVAGQKASHNAFFSKIPEFMDAFNDSALSQRALGYSVFSNLSRKDLRLTVFIRDDNYIHYSKPATESYFDNIALGSYITLPNQTRLAFVNMHLPFDKKSVKRSLEKEDPYIRANAVAKQNVLFNQSYRALVLDFKPDYAILMGDLGYQMTPRNWDPYQTAEYVLENPQDRTGDELHAKMHSGDIYPLQEATITFAPTCYLQPATTHQYKINPLIPSYCDRVLYQNYINDPKMHALVYDQLVTELPVTHLGVWSYFEFLQVQER